MIRARSGESETDAGRAAVAGHWDDLYATRGAEELSWTQAGAGVSAELIDALPVDGADPMVDVGGGAGVLVDHLLAAGHRRVTVLDASEHTAARAVDPGGHLVIGTFAANGPEDCSGLPVVGYGPDELAAQFRLAFDPVADRDEHHRTPWASSSTSPGWCCNAAAPNVSRGGWPGDGGR